MLKKRTYLGFIIFLGWIPAHLALAQFGTLDLEYSTFLGGGADEIGFAVAVDSMHCAYIIGRTQSTNFPTRDAFQGSYQPGGAVGYEAFAGKLSSTGSALHYSTYLGGSKDDVGLDIAVDSAFCAYLAGSTLSSDYPTLNPYQASSGGLTDNFICKLSSSGSALVYSTYLGGSRSEGGEGEVSVSLGPDWCAYITGTTPSNNFPTRNPYQAAGRGTDAYLSKLSSSGSILVFSTYLGGSGNDIGNDVAVGEAGCAYLVGWTSSADFPTLNPYQIYQGPDGFQDAFVCKFSSSGSGLIYSTYLGGKQNSDYGSAIFVDAAFNSYVTGGTWSSDFPTCNPYQASYGGGAVGAGGDAFVSKFSSTGTALLFSTYLGGSSDENAVIRHPGLAVDDDCRVYVAGGTQSLNFPTRCSYQSSRNGLNDLYLAALSSSGSELIFSSYLGGTLNEEGMDVAVISRNEFCIAGWTRSSDFPTRSPYQATYAGGSDWGDAFISKLTFITPVPTASIAPSPTPSVTSSPSPAPSSTPTPEPSVTPTPTPEPTATPSPSARPSPTPTPPRLVLAADDFDGDGTADLGLWRSADGSWRIRDVSIVYYGLNGDIPVTGDYNADGIADIAVFRPLSGKWCLRNPAGGSFWNAYFGLNGDVPVPADYDGDFCTDTAVWRPSNAGWYIRGLTRFNYGLSGDLPVPGDYNGDGTADASLYRHSVDYAGWYVRDITRSYYGQSGDIPVPGDYDGDGRTQLSVFRPSNGRWYIRDEGYVAFGQSGDIPAVFDYDGDGSAERVLYRSSEGRWYIYNVTSVAYGTSGDQAVIGTTY